MNNVTRDEIYSMVEAELGGGRVICDRCSATLDTFSDVCSADLLDKCPGFVAIDNAKADAWLKAMTQQHTQRRRCDGNV